MTDSVLYTIGHSNHDLSRFVNLLSLHGVTAIADVRSSPYSRFNPQFNRETLSASLKASAGLEYVYLGQELGARRGDPDCFDESGRVVFERVAETSSFQSGLQRVKLGMSRFRIALMCAEKDPLCCHRSLLICRYLRHDVPQIGHIQADGSIETQDALELRLLWECRLPEQDLFRSRADLIEDAYRQQAGRIAWVNESLVRS